MKNKGNMLLIYIMLIGLTFIVLTIVNIVVPNLKEVGHKTSGSQAFYIAEAGMHKAIWYLATDPGDGGKGVDWRGSTTEAFGRGSYSITVQDAAVSGEMLVISTGEVLGETKSVKQKAKMETLPKAFNYAVFCNEDFKSGPRVIISGDTFVKGNTTFGTNSELRNGSAYHPEGYTVSGNAEDGGTPDPEPSMPTFDTSYYDGEITVAEGYPPVAEQVYTDLDLGGATLYINGAVKIKNTGNITGPGTLVSTGTIEIEDSHQTDGTDMIFISRGRIYLDDTHDLSNCTFYARDRIVVKSDANITAASLLSAIDFDIRERARYTGLIFCHAAGDKGRVKSEAIVIGSAVAPDFNETSDRSITYDRDVLPSTLPPGFTPDPSYVVPIKGTWQEI